MSATTKRSILLVEDEAIIAAATLVRLAKLGYGASAVYSGEVAVERMLSDDASELVLMDIDLGNGIDGTEAARRILAKKTVPIVFLTSHTEDEYVNRVRSITRYGYVLKSSSDVVLRTSIEMAFDLFEAHAAIERNLRELEFKEEYLSITLRSIGDAVIVTDNAGRITRMNPVAERLTGWRFVEAEGRTLTDVFTAVDATTLLPIGNPLDRVFESGEVVRLGEHTKLLRRDGTNIQISDSAAPICDDDGNAHGAILVFADVTTKHGMQEELRASEARLRHFFEHSIAPTAIVPVNGRRRLNRAFAEMLGYTPEALERRDWRSYTHPDDVGRDDGIRESLLTGDRSTARWEKRYLHRDGSIVWVELHIVLLRTSSGDPDVFIITAIDVTQRKAAAEETARSREAIQSSEAMFRTLVHHMQVGVLLLGPDGSVLLCNPKALELLRVTEDDLKGARGTESAWNLVLENGEVLRTAESPIVRAIETRAPITSIVVGIDSEDTGRRTWMLVDATPQLDESDAVHAVVCTFVEITARVEAEERIRGLLEEKELILREVHHRVKNTMSTTLGLLTLQAEELDDPVALHAIEDARSRVTSMLLLHQRLSEKDGTDHVALADYLTTLVNGVVAGYPSRTSIRIITEFEQIEVDSRTASTIGLIVNELLTNIVKYAFVEPQGDATTAPWRETGTVRVAASRREGVLVLEVEDDGVGISDEIDLDTAPTLGLMIVRSLTAQLAGSIAVTRDEGTRFTLELSVVGDRQTASPA